MQFFKFHANCTVQNMMAKLRRIFVLSFASFGQSKARAPFLQSHNCTHNFSREWDLLAEVCKVTMRPK